MVAAADFVLLRHVPRGGRVVVADSPHPAQSKSGIQTIGAGEDQIQIWVRRRVFHTLKMVVRVLIAPISDPDGLSLLIAIRS